MSGINVGRERPIPPGQIQFTSAGTYSWVAPELVTEVSVVCIGGGAGGYTNGSQNVPGGGGGWLGWPSYPRPRC